MDGYIWIVKSNTWRNPPEPDSPDDYSDDGKLVQQKVLIIL